MAISTSDYITIQNAYEAFWNTTKATFKLVYLKGFYELDGTLGSGDFSKVLRACSEMGMILQSEDVTYSQMATFKSAADTLNTAVWAIFKTYDGDATATANFDSATLVTLLGSDTVTLNSDSASATFADANVDTAKTVTIAGLTLSDTDAGNYTLTQPTVTADITDARRTSCKAAGFTAMLEKPIRPRALIATLADTLMTGDSPEAWARVG